MMHRRSVIAAVLAVSALVATGLPAWADGLSAIKERGVLRVAVPQDFPPFGSVGADMAPQGYDIDTAALIAGALGVTLELTPVTSANRVPFLQTGKVDLVISSLGKNPDREKVIDFSVPYAPFFNGVFGAEEIAAADAAALSGKSIAVTRGALEDLELSKIAPADTVIKRYEDNNGTMSAFLSGQVDLVATGNVVAAAIIARNPPKLPVLKFLIKNSPCYIGLPKGETALKEAVDAAITAAKADGRLDAIARKWLNAGLPADL